MNEKVMQYIYICLREFGIINAMHIYDEQEEDI